MPNLVKIGYELLPKMSGNQVGRRTAEKAKIICPPPSGVDIIIWVECSQIKTRLDIKPSQSLVSTSTGNDINMAAPVNEKNIKIKALNCLN